MGRWWHNTACLALDQADLEVRQAAWNGFNEALASWNSRRRRDGERETWPGESGADVIELSLGHPDHATRRSAARALHEAPLSVGEVSTLSPRAVLDIDGYVRSMALEALASHANELDGDSLLAKFMNGLEDSRTRASAANGLRSMGAAARPAIPALLDACSEADSCDRSMIIRAIRAILPGIQDSNLSPCLGTDSRTE